MKQIQYIKFTGLLVSFLMGVLLSAQEAQVPVVGNPPTPPAGTAPSPQLTNVPAGNQAVPAEAAPAAAAPLPVQPTIASSQNVPVQLPTPPTIVQSNPQEQPPQAALVAIPENLPTPGAPGQTPSTPPASLPMLAEAAPTVARVQPPAQPSNVPAEFPQQTPAEVQQPAAMPEAPAPVGLAPEIQNAPQQAAQEQTSPQVPAAAPVASAVPEAPTPTFEQEGIDTFDQEGGNWLLKRQALEKTMDVIEKIKDVFTKTLESRIDYLVKRNKIERTFDAFTNEIGFELGDLSQLLSTLSAQLKQERKTEGDLTEEEREVLADIESKIAAIKGLKETVKIITTMDESLDDAIMQLEKEINTSNSYQTRAWKNFQTIKQVLSDEKAEELYLQTGSLLKNIQDIENYLKGDLLTYFDSVIDSLKQAMDKAQQNIKDLEAKGINLKDEVKKIKQARKARKKLEEQKQQEAAAPQEKKVAPKPAVVQEGWLGSIKNVLYYPVDLAFSGWNYVKSFFVEEKIVVRKPVVSVAKSKNEKEAPKEQAKVVTENKTK